MQRFIHFLVKTILATVQFLYFVKLDGAFVEFFRWVLQYIIRYRADIVQKNLTILRKRAPTAEEISQYYRHLSHLFLDTLGSFGASAEQFTEKVEISNFGIFDKIHADNQSATVLLSHIGNWEIFCQWAALNIPHFNIITLYTPIGYAPLNAEIQRLRERFGTRMISTKSTLELFRVQKRLFPCLNLFAIDQNPGAPHEQYWTDFFGKNVPIITGYEKFLKTQKQPVFYLHIAQNEHGKYILNLQRMEANFDSEYDLSRSVLRMLENNILENPTLWLLSHNRFKYEKK